MATVRQSARLAGVTKRTYSEYAYIPSSRSIPRIMQSIDYDTLYKDYTFNKIRPTASKKVTQAQMITNSLSRHGLRKKISPGDGNCLFHSLSDQLNGTKLFEQHDHISMRRNIVTHIYRHYDFYGPFIEDKLTKKLKPGTWGSHVDVSAAADLFNIKITLIKFNGDDIILPRHGDSSKVVAEIFMCFRAEVHYDSTERVEY